MIEPVVLSQVKVVFINLLEEIVHDNNLSSLKSQKIADITLRIKLNLGGYDNKTSFRFTDFGCFHWPLFIPWALSTNL